MEQSREIERQIQAGRRKVRLLEIERQKIADDIRMLRRVRQNLVESVIATNRTYTALQDEINAMVEMIPFTDAEKEIIQQELARRS